MNRLINRNRKIQSSFPFSSFSFLLLLTPYFSLLLELSDALGGVWNLLLAVHTNQFKTYLRKWDTCSIKAIMLAQPNFSFSPFVNP
jgi:hypothetical protein